MHYTRRGSISLTSSEASKDGRPRETRWRSYVWKFAFHPLYGLAAFPLKLAFGRPVDLLSDPHTAMATVAIVDVWQWALLFSVIIVKLLETLPRQPLEAARLDYARTWEVYFFIAIPMLKAPLISLIFVKMVESLRAFGAAGSGRHPRARRVVQGPGARWIRTRGISRRIASRAVRDSRTTKIGHSDFGPGDGSALAMRCPRCRAFPHCRTPRLDPVTAARRQRRVLATARRGCLCRSSAQFTPRSTTSRFGRLAPFAARSSAVHSSAIRNAFCSDHWYCLSRIAAARMASERGLTSPTSRTCSRHVTMRTISAGDRVFGGRRPMTANCVAGDRVKPADHSGRNARVRTRGVGSRFPTRDALRP